MKYFILTANIFAIFPIAMSVPVPIMVLPYTYSTARMVPGRARLALAGSAQSGRIRLPHDVGPKDA